MRLKFVAATFAAIGALALAAAPADAAPKKKTVVAGSAGHTVFTSRDENGRTRTRIIIQKRSYLDPGTETSPGESEHNYAYTVNQRAMGIFDNTPFGSNQTALPDAFTLPSQSNPLLRF
jgi:hypothetical protein